MLMSDELTPYEAENAVISILIKNPEVVFDVTTLKSMMFSSIVHKELYDLIQKIASNGHVPDRSLIEIQIQENPDILDQVDIAFLNYVMGYDYNPNNDGFDPTVFNTPQLQVVSDNEYWRVYI